MKGKAIAIFGVGAYVLSVIASATDLEGYSAVPTSLVAISAIATVAFVVAAVFHLWNKERRIAAMFGSAAIALFLLMMIGEFFSSPDGLTFVLLVNLARVAYLISFILILIKLFKKESNLQDV